MLTFKGFYHIIMYAYEQKEQLDNKQVNVFITDWVVVTLLPSETI